MIYRRTGILLSTLTCFFLALGFFLGGGIGIVIAFFLALATGRNPQNSAVAATTGLLDLLKSEEIAGVTAHELAHIKNRDTLLMTLTATLVGAISILINFAFFYSLGSRAHPLGRLGVILVMVFAPIGAALIQMSISRGREYGADKIGAEICG